MPGHQGGGWSGSGGRDGKGRNSRACSIGFHSPSVYRGRAEDVARAVGVPAAAANGRRRERCVVGGGGDYNDGTFHVINIIIGGGGGKKILISAGRADRENTVVSVYGGGGDR